MASLTFVSQTTIIAALDIERARGEVRTLALTLGLSRVATESAMLAVMELGTNLVRYATNGSIRLSVVRQCRRQGLQIESQDEGPGIADVDQALQDGFSTGGGLGNGLPAVRRLMDTFTLCTNEAGTTIVACKWQD